MAIELCESIGVLAIYENNQDRGKISPLAIQTVLAYYEDDVISRCSSNTKDTINVKQNNGEKKPVCCRYMVMSLQEAFELFKHEYKDNEDIKIGYTKFCYLKPKWIKLSIKKNICLCHFHENFRLLLVTFSTVIQESIKSNSLIEKIVCSRENSSCMYGNCLLCRTKVPSTEIPTLYSGIDLDEEVNWMKWANVNGKIDIHRLSGSVGDLLIEMDHQWSKFIMHSYITHAQFEHIRNLKQSLASDSALVHMDFAENYALEVQNEVMSKHWSTKQAALFTIQIRTNNEIINIVIVSDYLSHDTTFVSCAQKLICNHIKTFYPLVTTILYLSDGCSGHFKNNFSMLNLIKHYEDYQYKAEWIFYSTSHEKGPVDGLGAVVKSAARRETMRADGPQKALLSPVEFYDFLKQKFCSKSTNSILDMPHIHIGQIANTEKIPIWYLSEFNISEHFDEYLSDRCKTRPSTGPIFGIRSYHHFQLLDNATIRCKTTSDSMSYEDFTMFIQHQSKLKCVKRVLTMNDVNVNDYIAVEYQDDWWLAMIQALEPTLKEQHMTFLHPSGPRTSFKFPVRPDELNIELGNVICLLCQPPTLGTRYNYTIQQHLCDEIQELFSEY
ncbi:unnamed protein product [Rotaria magnacalcarata]|uniref:Uncharacterized protein n=1 Tax=Rotaria magnacalcarata TaxID=392030 RepID=A0A8S2W0V7_9BILA|nr:unnamed protein product [Rotaria magnacalcarata]